MPEVAERTTAELLSAIPAEGALVLPLITPAGAKAFVLCGGGRRIELKNVIDLPGLDDQVMRRWLFGAPGKSDDRGYVGAYDALRRALSDGEQDSEEAFEIFGAKLEATFKQVWETLLAPIDKKLVELGVAKGAPVVLMPPGLLSLLPIGAAGPPGGPPFSARWTVSAAPSFESLIASRKSVERWRAAGEPLAGVGVFDPAGAGHPPLPGARAEAALLVRLLPDLLPLVGGKATLAAVEAGLGAANLLHFSSHGFHHPTIPSLSAILLAGGERLTLEYLNARGGRIDGLRLAVLSSCETGLSAIHRAADEFIGLPAGFLAAGASAVVASHWPVRDDATLLTVWKLYTEWRERKTGEEALASPATALREAQRWLREATYGALAERFGTVRAGGETYVDLSVALRAPGADGVVSIGPTSEDEPGVGAGTAPNPINPRSSGLLLPMGPEHERPYAAAHHWAAFSVTGW